MFDWFKNLIDSMMWSAFHGFDQSITKACDILSGDLPGWSSMIALSNILEPFCLIVIGICLLLELAQVASKVDIIKWEHGLKIAVKMALARVCLDIAPTFLEACYVQAQDWVRAISYNAMWVGQDMFFNYAQPLIWAQDGIGPVLGMFLTSIIFIIAILICNLIIRVIAFGRIFEISVYLAISPFPFAFMPLGTGDGAGISHITSKFIKNFIAVCLQGVIMVVVMNVFGNVMEAVMRTEVGTIPTTSAAALTDICFTMMLGCIALVMSVVKSGSWAKSVIDAM